MLIGLTGQTGAGKSEVSAILRGYGFDVIDADKVSRETYAGGECLRGIVAEFGGGVLLPDGSLDRRALGAIVFTDEARRKKLETIVFPYIMRDIEAKVETLKRNTRCVFLDAPTLFESGADKSCDKVVSVIAPSKLRMKRVMERDGLSAQEAQNRMNAQHEDEWYVSRSDYVIRNDKTGAELRENVMKMIAVFGL